MVAGHAPRLVAAIGVLLAEHRRLARRLRLDEVVSIPRFVEDAFGLIGQGDVFVLSSLSEQSGSLAMLEALQAGRAIVASGVDSIPKDVTDGHDALLVPPGDEALLAEALARVLLDEPLPRRLGARETFEARFSLAPSRRRSGRSTAKWVKRPRRTPLWGAGMRSRGEQFDWFPGGPLVLYRPT